MPYGNRKEPKKQGFPKLASSVWFGIATRADVSPAVVEKVSADVREAMKLPVIGDKVVRSRGWDVVASTPAQMDKAIGDALPAIQESFKASGISK